MGVYINRQEEEAFGAMTSDLKAILGQWEKLEGQH